jgi:hypothetical protein
MPSMTAYKAGWHEGWSSQPGSARNLRLPLLMSNGANSSAWLGVYMAMQ